MKEKTVSIIALGIVGLVIVLFTLLGFFIKQDCDIDAVYLWCRLHPMSVGDVLGCIMFYAGAVGISGVWGKWIQVFQKEHSMFWSILFFAVTALGIVLIWNT